MKSEIVFTMDEFKKSQGYWLKKLGGGLQELKLFSDFPRTRHYQGVTYKIDFEWEIFEPLVQISKGNDLSLYIILLTALKIVFYKYSGQRDIIVSSPTYKSKSLEYNKIVLLRNLLGPKITFKELLLRVKETVVTGYKNQYYPVRKIIELLEIGDSALLFKIFVLLENIHDDIGKSELLNNYRNDMIVSFQENGAHLGCHVCYNSKLFKEETITRIIKHYFFILKQILSNRDIELEKIELSSPGEKKKILDEFNHTETWYPADKTIHGLFAEQVEKTQDHVALVFENRHMTYGELNKKSGGLASMLKGRGIEPGSIVGLTVNRSIEMVVGMLGILKAGCAYLPIDPGYPQERIDYIVKDSNARILVSELSKDHPTHLGYVIYTSGSTGKPKGVAVQHSSIVNTLWWQKNYYGFSMEESVLQIPSFSFDSSVEDIFTPLISGSRLVLIEQENRLNLEYLAKRIIDQRITHFLITPGLYRAFLNEIAGSLTGLKTVTLAGESFTAELVKDHFKKLNSVKLYNEYGPTENSVCSTVYEFTDDGCVRIGKPINNVKVFILNRGGGLNPVGVPGELCVSGAGLARGYLNRPELTNEKFLRGSRAPRRGEPKKAMCVEPNTVRHEPFVMLSPPGRRRQKLYKTGDLARWLAAGDIEFLGRLDEQVKIRGFRIEPGEIEKRLCEHDRISESVVISRESNTGDKCLCAYFISDGELTAPELREYLVPELPDYMIPSYFIRLTQLPLTANGKIDRSALPDPGKILPEGEVEYVPPRNDVERRLKETWETVLGRDKIGITDNFFAMGGDSIKSIQIAARMKKAGYRVEMKDMFQYPTISVLAPFVKKEDRTADQSVITGTLPLTPIQRAFFQRQKTGRHHYNHAVMLHLEEGFDEEMIGTLFKKIQEHHDALRMTYKEENGEIIQTNHGLSYPFSLQVYDLRNRGDAGQIIETAANRVQAGIDLEKGPLMRLALFRLDNGGRLLIVIHHLVIDGISWRILFEDIETLYRQYKMGESLELPPKSDSFKLWSGTLSGYADSEEFLKEGSWWEKLESVDIPGIEKGFPGGGNYMKDTEHLSFRLSEEETTNLLTKANKPFGTEINDILLTALGLAVKKTWGINRVLIALESHGRQEIIKDVDVSRTVGWFSSVYPVLLDLAHETNLPRQVKEMKENLRRVPNKGIGYGILRYLTSPEHKAGLEFKLNPPIGFNYLGQFDADVGQSTFKTSRESIGNVLGPNIKRDYEIDISGMITDKSLFISIAYSKNQYAEEVLREFLGHYETGLRYIISYCTRAKEIELTPSDLTFRELGIAEIEAVEALFNNGNRGNVKDIYPLSPMQEGMFFHCLYNKSASEYFEQVSYRFYGNLNESWVEESLNELLKRHDILRTAFIHEIFDRPLQVVLKQRRVDFHFEDLIHVVDKEEKALYIKKFKEQDRRRSFELDRDVLMRVSLFRTGDGEYELTWSHHHLLMDGWCTGILISEFLEIYNGLGEGRPYRLPEVVQYRTYIRWLERQDREAPGKYWQAYLEGYEGAAVIPGINKPGGSGAGYRLEKMVFPLDRETTTGLDNLAVKNRVTLNTVVRAIWGIILARYNDRQDVVFGVVVSGRPPDVEGIETMVGIFINTIPVRLRFDMKTTFKELIRRVQEDAVESEPYHYFQLAEIQAQTPLKHNLMDHILAFQNIRPGDWTRNKAETGEKSGKGLELELGSFESFEHSNYDLNVVVNPGPQLRISFHYNGNAYKKELLERIFYHFKQVTDQILENEEAVIVQLDFLSADEKSRLIKKIWGEKGKLPHDDTGIMENREKSLEAKFNF